MTFEVDGRVYHTGAPPHVGWWQCQVRGSLEGRDTFEGDYERERYTPWRWWNGTNWSTIVYPTMHVKRVGLLACMDALVPARDILWCDYWPKNARVPRAAQGSLL